MQAGHQVKNATQSATQFLITYVIVIAAGIASLWTGSSWINKKSHLRL